MFFDDAEIVKKRSARIRLPPPIPETGWCPPEFPNLSAASVLSFDVETKELDLDNGPGWARKTGHICGVSIGAKDRTGNRGAWYFPVRHEIEAHLNLDTRNVFSFMNHWLSNPHTPKIGANLTYDIGWLAEEDVTVAGELHDIQFAEALIDSDAKVALDVLSQKYLGVGKTTSALYDWIRQAYPNTPETKLRSDIHRSPPQLVGPYAEDDSNYPIDIFERQAPILDREGLAYVYRLECDLIPLIIRMRQEGVSIDVAAAEKLLLEVEAETRQLYLGFYEKYDINLKSTSAAQLEPVFAKLGIIHPYTDEAKGSFKKEWLAALEHPIGEEINRIRETEKMASTFLRPMLKINVNGKLFTSFHQMKNDENGTFVGRFASSNLNLQQVPSRTKLGKKIRQLYIPDPGNAAWIKFDYSQIHYRILAHYAVGPGSDGLRLAYNSDPTMDYHNQVYHNVAPLLNWDITDPELNNFRRRPIKNINFGLLYGQSEKSLVYKTASYFGESFTQADGAAFFKAYFEGAPYVKPTMKAIAAEVQRDGYVSTILGRRIRFSLFEPENRQRGVVYDPLPYHIAIRKYGSPLVRAYEYRGVNYKFQGSEPDIMKHGMRDLWRSGVLDVTGVPRLTVHDECDYNVREKTPEMMAAFAFVQETMQNTIKLKVPIYVDRKMGDNWGLAD